MDFLEMISRSVIQGIRRFNARRVPPEKYMENIMLGMSEFEETYFVAKNFLDGSIHV